MKVTISKKLWLGFGIILFFMCVISILMLVNTNEVSKGFGIVVNKGLPSLVKGEQLIQAVESAQHGHIGFCVTGNEEYLKAYTDNLQKAEGLLDELKKLGGLDDTDHIKLMNNILSLFKTWQKKIAEPEIELAKEVRKGKVESRNLQDVLAAGKGKDILDNMRIVTEKMMEDFRIDGNIEGENIVRSIVKCQVDKETGQRGFLITGKESFLEPYTAGGKKMQADIKKLEILVSNAHSRKGTGNNINEIEKLGNLWRKVAGKPEIELRRQIDEGTKTQADIQQALSHGQGKSILDKMRTIMDRMEAEFTKAQNDKGITLLIRVAKSMVDQETGQRGFIITGDETFLEPFKTGEKEFNKSLNELRELNSNAYDLPVMKGNISKLTRLAAEWEEKAAAPEIDLRRKINVFAKAEEKLSSMLKVDAGEDLKSKLEIEFENFILAENQDVQRDLAAVEKTTRFTVYTTIIFVILAIIICIITAIFITFSISKPIRYITQVAQKIAEKDLTVEVEIKGKRSDEIGDLAKAFKVMMKSLRGQAVEMSSGATQLATSINEISATTTQLAASTTETSTSITQISTTVEEVRQTSQASHEKAAEVSKKAEAIAKTIDGGMQATENTIEGINKINEEMEYIAQSTIKLGEQTQNIGEIINTVNGLADQSNLLSVNASIEAAKAGEYGKGFAVVAREVKNLADLSKEATKQIGTILTDIQKAASAAVLATERGSNAVKEGLELSAIAGSSINELSVNIRESSEASIQIAAGSQQQVSGMDQLASTMENIKEALEQNVNGTNQLESAAQSIDSLGQKLQAMASEFKTKEENFIENIEEHKEEEK